MPQARVRTKLTHDPASMEGQAYVPHVVYYEVDCSSGSGTADLVSLPPGSYILYCLARIEEALDASATVDIGTHPNGGALDDDALIDNSEWTEETADEVACSLATTAAGGAYLKDGGKVVVSVGGADTTQGKVEVAVSYLCLDQMQTEFHDEVATS